MPTRCRTREGQGKEGSWTWASAHSSRAGTSPGGGGGCCQPPPPSCFLAPIEGGIPVSHNGKPNLGEVDPHRLLVVIFKTLVVLNNHWLGGEVTQEAKPNNINSTTPSDTRL